MQAANTVMTSFDEAALPWRPRGHAAFGALFGDSGFNLLIGAFVLGLHRLETQGLAPPMDPAVVEEILEHFAISPVHVLLDAIEGTKKDWDCYVSNKSVRRVLVTFSKPLPAVDEASVYFYIVSPAVETSRFTYRHHEKLIWRLPFLSHQALRNTNRAILEFAPDAEEGTIAMYTVDGRTIYSSPRSEQQWIECSMLSLFKKPMHLGIMVSWAMGVSVQMHISPI